MPCRPTRPGCGRSAPAASGLRVWRPATGPLAALYAPLASGPRGPGYALIVARQGSPPERTRGPVGNHGAGPTRRVRTPAGLDARSCRRSDPGGGGRTVTCRASTKAAVACPRSMALPSGTVSASFSPGLETTAATILPAPNPEVTVSYPLQRPWLPGTPWSLTFRTEPAGATTPPLVVVAHPRAVPLSVDDGEIVARTARPPATAPACRSPAGSSSTAMASASSPTPASRPTRWCPSASAIPRPARRGSDHRPGSLRRSHTRIDPSAIPLTSREPSGVNASAGDRNGGPSMVRVSLPVATSIR